ncbi:MAG: IS4 family transposase, partial [Bacteroidetes bacterium]|nr:IS4 family transposase [Bacteroidota bacterium]
FDRGYNDFKRLYRINALGSFFVIRSKGNLKYEIVRWKRRLPKNVLSDAEIVLTGFYPSQYYPTKLRLVRYWDEEQGREFMFLTNARGLSSLLVAELYKNRWQIELFFKWLKQHLKVKKFWGTSENAVKTQIYVAIITYCLVAVVQHDMRLERSTYEILQILSISLTDKTPLKDLFNKTDYHNVKEQINTNELLLFYS